MDDELCLLRREVRETTSVRDRLNELRERRISEIEEVLATPWPRRWLLGWRWRQQVRRSARECAWAGEAWHDRRAQAMSEEFYGIDSPSPPSSPTPESHPATPASQHQPPPKPRQAAPPCTHRGNPL
jgi:hypothetical protein